MFILLQQQVHEIKSSFDIKVCYSWHGSYQEVWGRKVDINKEVRLQCSNAPMKLLCGTFQTKSTKNCDNKLRQSAHSQSSCTRL